MQIGELTIHFRTVLDTLPKSYRMVPTVICTVHNGNCLRESEGRPCTAPHAIMAISQCSPKDTDKPLVGRKKALARALVGLALNKDQRTAFWLAFNHKVGIPKSNHRKFA